MNYAHVLKSSLKRVFTNPIKCLALLLIILVSACFGLVTVISFMLMPDAMEDYPVAIVNKDKGAISDGEQINLGDEIIEQVKDNDSVSWKICDPKDFGENIEDTEYSTAFVIPENFSENVVSAKSSEPVKADIYYLSNMRDNFLFSQFTKNIRNEFQDMVAKSISKSYVISTFDILEDIRARLTEAAEGSRDLSNAINAVDGGISQLKTGSDSLTEGSSALNAAASSLADGTLELNKNVENISIREIELSAQQQTQIFQTAADSEQVSAAADKLSLALADSMSSVISEKLNNIDLLLSNDNTAASISKQLISSSPVAGDISVALTAQGYSQDEAEAMITSIVSGTLKSASAEIPDISGKAETTDEIYSSIHPSITESLKSLAGECAVSGSEVTADAINEQLKSASQPLTMLPHITSRLSSGALSLSDGITTLNDGANTLSGGISSLGSGISRMSSGSTQLTAGLEEGSSQLEVNLVNSSDEMGEFISSPAKTTDRIYGKLTKYSQGFAPLFMSLGLWIGALILFFVIPARPKSEIRATSPEVVFSVYTTAAIVGIIEAIAICTGALITGLDPVNTAWLYIFAIFVSLVFIAVTQCFVTLFGIGGNLISILLTIIQIPSCGGTFPVDVMPGFFEAISPFLPLTYSIDGFREITSGGKADVLIYDSLILLIFMAVFILITLLLQKSSQKCVDFIEGEISK